MSHVLNVQSYAEQIIFMNTYIGSQAINKSKKMITIKVTIGIPSWEEQKESD